MGPEALGYSEREVLELLAQGFNDRAISIKICLQDQSVRKIVQRIYYKLEIEGNDLNKRVRAAVIYMEVINGTSGS